jgi:ubiquinone/menaquinone biosynthesis C-methylase UbiE
VDIEKLLDMVRKAYDLTVEQYLQRINPLDDILEAIKNSPFYKSLAEDHDELNAGSPEVKDYLNPESGMQFLDAGCSANLVNYRLDRWPSTFYGVDISPALIDAMKKCVSRENIIIGGLYVTDLTRLPFDDSFFHISMVIGVLEYCTFEYLKTALFKLNRVMKPGARVALDIPNPNYLFVHDMERLELHLKRPIFIHPRSEFEKLLEPLFSTERVEDSKVMLKYFLKAERD